ncbi:prolyl oligopeptidase family serine peptidase [bacterium]|nr:prolyl oligopeptidase family serine peptidase [bacterium]
MARPRRRPPRMRAFLASVAVLLALAPLAHAQRKPAPSIRQIHIRSSVDGHSQPAWFSVPNKARYYKVDEKPVGLVVALHSWHSTYSHSYWKKYRRECDKFDFAMIHPNFRGSNTTPESCGSALAVQDILDAVQYACDHARIDPRRVFLVGCSGGGHMALLMAARAPHVWAGVSAWVPPTDLAAWYRECEGHTPRYTISLENVCGGPPGPTTDTEYRRRSPLFHLAAAKGVPIDINAGIHDGHDGPTPISHSLRAFNALAQANGHTDKALTPEQIDYLVRRRKVPESLADAWEPDIRRRTRILFRRSAGPARITVFNGKHEIDFYAAIRWCSLQPPRLAHKPNPNPEPVTHHPDDPPDRS